MVEYGIYIWWEHRVVVVVDNNSGVGPPQEGLGEGCAVVNLDVYLQIGLVGIEREALHTLCAEHTLNLAAPYGYATIGIVLDGVVGG